MAILKFSKIDNYKSNKNEYMAYIEAEEDDYGDVEKQRIVIPPYHNGLPVRSLGNSDTGDREIDLVLPDTLERLESGAISEMDIKKLIIPKSVSKMDFLSIASSFLEEVVVHPDNPYFKAIDNIIYSKDGKELVNYLESKQETTFSIPTEVKIIRTGAFYNNLYLEEIIFQENTVEEIGSYAFANSKIKVVKMNEGIKYIGDHAFENCKKLEEVFLPNSLKYIGESCFKKSNKANLYCAFKKPDKSWPKTWYNKEKNVIYNNSIVKNEVHINNEESLNLSEKICKIHKLSNQKELCTKAYEEWINSVNQISDSQFKNDILNFVSVIMLYLTKIDDANVDVELINDLIIKNFNGNSELLVELSNNFDEIRSLQAALINFISLVSKYNTEVYEKTINLLLYLALSNGVLTKGEFDFICKLFNDENTKYNTLWNENTLDFNPNDISVFQINDQLKIILPNKYNILHDKDEEGNDISKIVSGKYKDEDGKKQYKFTCFLSVVENLDSDEKSINDILLDTYDNLLGNSTESERKLMEIHDTMETLLVTQDISIDLLGQKLEMFAFIIAVRLSQYSVLLVLITPTVTKKPKEDIKVYEHMFDILKGIRFGDKKLLLKDITPKLLQDNLELEFNQKAFANITADKLLDYAENMIDDSDKKKVIEVDKDKAEKSKDIYQIIKRELINTDVKTEIIVNETSFKVSFYYYKDQGYAYEVNDNSVVYSDGFIVIKFVLKMLNMDFKGCCNLMKNTDNIDIILKNKEYLFDQFFAFSNQYVIPSISRSNIYKYIDIDGWLELFSLFEKNDFNINKLRYNSIIESEDINLFTIIVISFFYVKNVDDYNKVKKMFYHMLYNSNIKKDTAKALWGTPLDILENIMDDKVCPDRLKMAQDLTEVMQKKGESPQGYFNISSPLGTIQIDGKNMQESYLSDKIVEVKYNEEKNSFGIVIVEKTQVVAKKAHNFEVPVTLKFASKPKDSNFDYSQLKYSYDNCRFIGTSYNDTFTILFKENIKMFGYTGNIMMELALHMSYQQFKKIDELILDEIEHKYNGNYLTLNFKFSIKYQQ